MNLAEMKLQILNRQLTNYSEIISLDDVSG